MASPTFEALGTDAKLEAELDDADVGVDKDEDEDEEEADVATGVDVEAVPGAELDEPEVVVVGNATTIVCVVEADDPLASDPAADAPATVLVAESEPPPPQAASRRQSESTGPAASGRLRNTVVTVVDPLRAIGAGRPIGDASYCVTDITQFVAIR